MRRLIKYLYVTSSNPDWHPYEDRSHGNVISLRTLFNVFIKKSHGSLLFRRPSLNASKILLDLKNKSRVLRFNLDFKDKNEISGDGIQE
ncbi:hypothetical protein TNCT_470111 [Trichonephila clavata]|uniref:Uncharacterized protein n=1 Tax=Trichonephila clavata TaxID=2740835 RepID=A0A8X6F6S2_TRICU|nr:hypothetical protein TNCT_470111 [Trichonephila clavata]